MGNIVKCSFNVFEEGRQYTGHHRNYMLESVKNVCYSPKTREALKLRELFGFFGHGRRQLAGKLSVGEVEPVKLPDGSTIIVENVPSNVCVFLEADENGNVEHHQEILESVPGKLVLGLHQSKVGGFSWAMGGDDGGAVGLTLVKSLHGFDYVLQPGFAKNRGYILESAEDQMILENICKLGVEDKDAERYLRHWVASAQARVMELEEELNQAAVFEDALREQTETMTSRLVEMEGTIAEFKTQQEAMSSASEAKRKMVFEAAQKCRIVVPEKALDAMLRMADEKDFFALVEVFEAARQVDLGRLPLPGKEPPPVFVDGHVASDPPEYGSAWTACDFEDPKFG